MEAMAQWYAFRIITEAPGTVRVPTLLQKRVNEILEEEGHGRLAG